MKNKVILSLILSLIALAGLPAQTNTQKGLGVIIFADGDEVTVYRGNALKSYSVSTGTVFGLQLEGGDLVQTSPGTSVEIQLLPSQTVIKVAENTSFRLTGINTGNGSTVDIIYGRIRAKVDPMLGQNGFSIRGKTAVAAVRGTDFGYDVVAMPGIGQEPSSQVYCFDGSVSLIPLQPEDWNDDALNKVFDSASFKDRKAYAVPVNQMVSVFDTPDESAKTALGNSIGKESSVSIEGKRSVISAPDIKNSIKVYWKNHPDQGKLFSNDELQGKFYGLKVATSPQDSTIPASNTDSGNQKSTVAMPRSSLADAIQPLPITKPIGSLSPSQYVMEDSAAKVVGIILGTAGLVCNLGGLALYNFGTDLGMVQADAQTAGVVTVSTSSVLLLSGLIAYIIGLFQ